MTALISGVLSEPTFSNFKTEIFQNKKCPSNIARRIFGMLNLKKGIKGEAFSSAKI